MIKKVVVIGGGHGQSLICRALKQIDNITISAIVTVADDGGSTGRLRKQFHIPAMGDIRNVLISLSEKESVMRDLMDYRFATLGNEDIDVQGHNLGNLILTALTEETGSFLEAIQVASDVLKVKGKIIPATTEIITLYARMEDGVIVKGEANIPSFDHHIEEVFYDKKVTADKDAVEAIKEADLIIYGIGSVYTSILPNVIIDDIQQALHETKAKKLYVCNAMTQPGETDGYSVEDHVNALLKHDAPLDGILIPCDILPSDNVARYEEQGSTPVYLRSTKHDYKIIRKELLCFDNGLIRHDVDKLKNSLEEIINEI